MELRWSRLATRQYKALENDPSMAMILKDVRNALGKIETNLRHPSLNTHEYEGLMGENGEKVLEAYAQQNTSNAHRIQWHYGPGRNIITIIAIIPHP